VCADLTDSSCCCAAFSCCNTCQCSSDFVTPVASIVASAVVVRSAESGCSSDNSDSFRLHTAAAATAAAVALRPLTLCIYVSHPLAVAPTYADPLSHVTVVRSALTTGASPLCSVLSSCTAHTANTAIAALFCTVPAPFHTVDALSSVDSFSSTCSLINISHHHVSFKLTHCFNS
jgi:hypothetical protein